MGIQNHFELLLRGQWLLTLKNQWRRLFSSSTFSGPSTNFLYTPYLIRSWLFTGVKSLILVLKRHSLVMQIFFRLLYSESCREQRCQTGSRLNTIISMKISRIFTRRIGFLDAILTGLFDLHRGKVCSSVSCIKCAIEGLSNLLRLTLLMDKRESI